MVISREVTPSIREALKLALISQIGWPGSPAVEPRRALLHFSLRGLPGVEDKLLEIVLFHQLLELSPKRTTVHGTMAYTVMESAILSGSRSLRVGWEWSRVPDDVLALDGAVHLIHGDFKQSEVGFTPVDLGEVPSGPLAWGSGWQNSKLHPQFEYTFGHE